MLKTENLNSELSTIKKIAYNHCSLLISDYKNDVEGKEYKACQFKLNELSIICRNGKITPKKIGQFVTFWKRNKNGITEPFKASDQFDFYLINVNKNHRLGQFIFPKSTLIKKGIISTSKKDGKRGFRVYPIWDTTNNQQAEKTQQWQLNYFVEYNDKVNLEFVKKLFEEK
ncbi:MAG: MepB family protein [Saprospiraceae bacterium]